MTTADAARPEGVTVAAPLAAPAPPGSRLEAIDVLRGMVMVLMLLDHTRDFVHAGAFHFDPTDLARTSPALFLTRWITHFCAPIFVLLAGTGAYLQRSRGKSRGELSRFLLSRGLWLVVLEFTLVRIGYAWNLDYTFLGVMQVIWAIGASMIALAALIHLPTAAVAAFGAGMVALHNLLDGIRVEGWRGPGTPAPDASESAWILLHQPQELLFPVGADGPNAFVLYPLIPWVGVMALGYALGALYTWHPERRRRWLLGAGAAAILAFGVLRAINGYGDPAPWTVQSRPGFTALSFLNVAKYPPSLLYLLMTLGPALLALAWLEGARGRWRQPLLVFGRVPLFYYLLQWPMAKAMGVVFTLLAGKSAAFYFANFGTPAGTPPADAGFGLGAVYLGWVVGVLLLYPACAWMARVKRRRRDWWLGYV